MLVFDIESDGLLDTITKVHCINVIDYETGEAMRFTDHETYKDPYTGEDTGEPTPRTGDLQDALQLLTDAPDVGGQNIIEYDIPALRIVYPDWSGPKGTVWDTRVMSRVMYPDLKERDFKAIRKGRLPYEFEKGGLIGKHSLEAWGIRVGGEAKADFKPKDYGRTWSNAPFSKDMDDYCLQDVRTNVDVFRHFFSKGYSEQCLRLEHDVAEIIARQQRAGFEFDEEKAVKLLGELQTQHAALADSLTEVFQPWFTWDGPHRGLQTPKRTMKRFVEHPEGAQTRKYKGRKQRGWYEHRREGCEFTKLKLQVFNPTSRAQIANRLQKVKGWKPKDFTPSGQPTVDESVLKSLAYPEAQQLAELFEIDKKIGQIANGKNAWLKFTKTYKTKRGISTRIHGKVNTNGAVTGRMSHSKPNVAQVDKDPRMRSCWIVRPGYRLVGCDADGLELRCLAHYMSRWDDGEYGKVVVEGKKSDKTDNHSVNQRAVGLNERDNAKTWIYAFLYGAGDYKLGTVVVDDFDDEKRERFNDKFRGRKRDKKIVQLGKRSRSRIAEGLPALGKLISKVKKKAKKTGKLTGLDGRQLHIRSEHAALNTLLQSAGAVLMKQALVLLDRDLKERGFKNTDDDPWSYDYEFVANVHDEFQIEVKEEHAETVGRLAADAIARAGEPFGFRIPLAGSSDIGVDWSETH